VGAEWMRQGPAPESGGPPPLDLHTDRPHSARVYDYLNGGKTNYPADRMAAEEALRANPTGRIATLANRAFMHRATRFLAGRLGIRQFLDVGTGIPTEPNLHQIAQQQSPDARIVYADNDPIVLAHSRALMASSPEGRTVYVHGDMLHPKSILDAPQLRATLDLGRPVGLTLIAVMHLIRNVDEAYHVCRQFVDAMPSGSYLALSHLTDDYAYEQVHGVSETYARRGMTLVPRPRAQIERFFDGLELVDPGLTLVHRWRCEATVVGELERLDPVVSLYGAVARIP
jgi:S-adenosyl methyltransferase